MFKPKMYKNNGMEAYHLISDDGGSFLYEGSIEYSEAELFKDEQGRSYFLVTTQIGDSKYYVEVEPEGKPIPVGQKEKLISGLIMASPREPTPQEPAAAEPAKPEPIVTSPPVEEPAAKQPDTCFESPEKPAEPPEIKPETVPEKEAVPDESPEYKPPGEAQAAVKAMAALGEKKHRKKSIIPIILALLMIIVVVAAAGIAVYRPGLISGLPFISKPTPTPEPTAVPTPLPTATPTATPEPTIVSQPVRADMYNNLLAIAPLIDPNNTSIQAYIANNTNKSGTSYGKLALVCDLFDAVNGKWYQTNENGVPQNVNESLKTMKGSTMDYSILMASLAEAEGMEVRVVAVYYDDSKTYVYYPEVKAALNDLDYVDVKSYLRGRYDIQNPFEHRSGVVHWLSMAMNKTAGGYVDSKYAYAVNTKSEIQPV